MTPKPDTSPANIARVLRRLLDQMEDATDRFTPRTPFEREALALADALDAVPVVTWEDGVERLARHLESTSIRICGGEDADDRNRREYDQRAAVALRTVFPDLAPPTETPDR